MDSIFERLLGSFMSRDNVSAHLNRWIVNDVMLNDDSALTLEILEDWDNALLNGRDGLGTVIVKAAGNDADNAQGDFLNAVRASITVAAYDSDGDASWYTNRRR